MGNVARGPAMMRSFETVLVLVDAAPVRRQRRERLWSGGPAGVEVGGGAVEGAAGVVVAAGGAELGVG